MMDSSLDVEREPFMSTSAPTSPTKTSSGGASSLMAQFDNDFRPNNSSNSNNAASSINLASDSASAASSNHQQQQSQQQQLNLNHPSNRHKPSQRSVKFPEEIVSGYHEAPNPYRYVAEEDNDVESVVIAYEEACTKQNIKPIPTVMDQIKNFKCNRMRAQDLILRGVQLDAHHCEALEEILKRVLFRLIDLESCNLDCDGASALFDMIEFYESASHLSIAKNKLIGVIGWQALCRTLKKTACLQYLDLSNTGLNEQILLIMGRTIRVGSHLVALHLENAGLFGRRLAILVSSIKFNTSLRELYLGENKICSTDCVQLGNLLRGNSFLNVLDLRNNFIQDIGLDHICEGLAHQPSSNTLFDIFETATRGTISQNSGILILNLSENQLTSRAMSRLAQTMSQCRSLIGLDLSNNSLGDDGIVILKEGLLQCRTLKYLNLSNTNITCEGANAIADVISRCAKLSILDLSRNDLKFFGITLIRNAIKSNKSLTKMVLIPQNCHANKPEPNQSKIDQMMDEIDIDCSQNKFEAKFDELDEILRGFLRSDISIYNDNNNLNDTNNNFSFISSNTNSVLFSSCDNMQTKGNQSESSDEENNSVTSSGSKKALMRTASLGSWDAPKRSGRFSVSPVVSENESSPNLSNPEIHINVDMTFGSDENQESLVYRENVDSVETRSYSSDENDNEEDDNDSDLSHNETDQLTDLPTKDMLMNRLMPPPRSFRRMSTPTISELVKPVRKPNLKLKLSCNLESLDLRSSLPLSPTFFAKFDFSDLSLLRLPTEVEEIISNLPVYGDDFDDLIFNYDTENFCFESRSGVGGGNGQSVSSNLAIGDNNNNNDSIPAQS